MPNRKLEVLVGRIVSLPRDDVDTDQIIPAAFLKTTGRDGLGAGLFATWRRDPEFVLNRPHARGAEMLLAGHNFGCGSSREHAVWALTDFGFRAVVSTGFSDIFRANALKNGLVAAEIEPRAAARLRSRIEADPTCEVTLDLRGQILVLPDGSAIPFDLDPFARLCLLDGVDQLGYLLREAEAIATFEDRHRDWIDTDSAAESESRDS